jgi:predicted nuclease of predicted toxin-antitoxin system
VHKLLFDNNISHRVLSRLGDVFSESSHVMLEELDQSSDLDVWNFAKKNDYCVVTKDSDFNDLAFLKGTPPKVIWLKLGNCKVGDIENIFTQYSDEILDFLGSKESSILEI